MDDWDHFKLRVREASDIASVVGERVTLKRKGREFVGLCPFHDDHNPSMAVVPGKEIFHCFVCGAGGDVFSFLQRYHGLEFMESLLMLAERAGIDPPRRGRGSGGVGGGGGVESSAVGRHEIVGVNKRAQAFFRAVFSHPEHGAAARAVIDRRGISPAMVERFGIGAAPARWDGLKLMADREGWNTAAMVAAGLLKRREGGPGGEERVYDAFRNRVIFPIVGESGEPTGFGARRIDDKDDPKYLNSADSVVFKKSGTLFGLPLARGAIRAADEAVVVEGYTDVIACHQAGIERVVGTLGTAFTAEHARKLRGLCSRVVLLFDGDEAGQMAADRAFEVLVSAKLDVAVATLAGSTDAKDPDELLKREGGAQTLGAILAGAQHVADFWGRRMIARMRGAEPAARAAALEAELTRLAGIGVSAMRPAERRMLMERLSTASGVPYAELMASMPGGRRPASVEPASGRDEAPTARDLRTARLSAVEYLIACALAQPELTERLLSLCPSGPDDPRCAAILGAMMSSPGVKPFFEDAALSAAAATLERRAEAQAGDGEGAVGALFEAMARRLESHGPAGAADDDVGARIAAVRKRASAADGPAGTPWKRRKPRA